MAHDTLIIRLAALSCTSRCVIFALLHLLLRFQLERLRVWSVAGWLAGWQANGRERRGGVGEEGRVAWLHIEEAEEEETWCSCQASKKYCIGI
jgi:hypothetical protein